jgi:hypothetical protein
MSELGENTKGQKNGIVAGVRDEYLEQHGLNGPTFSAEKEDSGPVNQSANSFDRWASTQALT